MYAINNVIYITVSKILTNFDEDRFIFAPGSSYICLRFLPSGGAENARLSNLFWQSRWSLQTADLFDFRLVTSWRTRKQFFVFRLLTRFWHSFFGEMSSIGTGVSMPYVARYTIARCDVNRADIREPNLTFVPVWPVRLAIFSRRTCISSGIRAESRGKWRVSFVLVPYSCISHRNNEDDWNNTITS